MEWEERKKEGRKEGGGYDKLKSKRKRAVTKKGLK